MRCCLDHLPEYRGPVSPALDPKATMARKRIPYTRKRSYQPRAPRGKRLEAPSALYNGDTDSPIPRVGTLARTRRLLLAALRVWELKHGIRD